MNRLHQHPEPTDRSGHYCLEVLVEVELTPGGPVFVARCLQHDICVQSKDLELLKHRFNRVLMGTVLLNVKEGKEPFEGVPKAPEDVWEKYLRKSTPIEGASAFCGDFQNRLNSVSSVAAPRAADLLPRPNPHYKLYGSLPAAAIPA